MLRAAGGFPIAELQIVGNAAPVVVQSLADIKRLANQMDAGALSRAKAELCRRRKQWKEADQRLSYSTAVAQVLQNKRGSSAG